MLDEMERSLHDSLCAVKRVMESKAVVAGGGAVEAALSIYLENFATSLVSACTEFQMTFTLEHKFFLQNYLMNFYIFETDLRPFLVCHTNAS